MLQMRSQEEDYLDVLIDYAEKAYLQQQQRKNNQKSQGQQYFAIYTLLLLLFSNEISRTATTPSVITTLSTVLFISVGITIILCYICSQTRYKSSFFMDIDVIKTAIEKGNFQHDIGTVKIKKTEYDEYVLMYRDLKKENGRRDCYLIATYWLSLVNLLLLLSLLILDGPLNGVIK